MSKLHVKVVLTVLIIAFPIMFCILFGQLLARTGEHSNTYHEPLISIENAPEGTAYLDILVKMKPSSNNYVDFAEWEMPPKIITGWSEEAYIVQDKDGNEHSETKLEPIWKELSITPDSEIARYNDNGYVSLSVHLKEFKGFYSYAHSDQTVTHRLIWDGMRGDLYLTKLIKQYGKFKAAYVGENGEVLSVTGKSSVRYKHFDQCEFSANGNELALTIWGDPAWKWLLLALSFYGEPVAIGLLIAINHKPKRKLYLPPRPECNPRSIEERNKENGE